MNLTARDLQMFAAIGVPEFIVRDAGIRRVTHDEAREICGIRYRAITWKGSPFRTGFLMAATSQSLRGAYVAIILSKTQTANRSRST